MKTFKNIFKISIKYSFLLVFFLASGKNLFAQKDSILLGDSTKAYISVESVNETIVNDTTPIVKKKTDKNPAKAMIMSAVLPGLGQIYNQRYWKVPVIYGLFTGMYLLSEYNNKRYKKYLHDYIAISDNDTSTHVVYFPRLRTDELMYWKDRYRRDRDLDYILLAGIWILNIFDASVDAHMVDFDVNESLSLHIDPFYYRQLYANSGTFGVSLKFRF